MLDGSMYSNGIFTDKISQDLGVTEEAIQGAASLEVVISALICFVTNFITQKYGPKLVASGRALIAVLGVAGRLQYAQLDPADHLPELGSRVRFRLHVCC